MSQSWVKSLLIIAALYAPNAIAIDYYWDTTNPPGNVQWTEGTSVTGADTLNINDPLSTTQTLDNDGTIEINNSTDMVVNNNITGTGTINTNTGSLIFGSSVTSTNTITNDIGGTVQIPSLITVNSGDISNSGTFELGGTVVLTTFTNTVNGSINLENGGDNTINGNLINNGDIEVANGLLTSTIDNFGNMVVSSSIGAFPLTNKSGGTLEFAAGTDGNNTQVINEGTFNITGDMSIGQRMDNYATMTIDANITTFNTPTINAFDGTLDINSVNPAQRITLQNLLSISGGVVNVTNAVISTVDNSSELNVYDYLECFSITNNSTMNLSGNVLGALSNNGTIAVSGNRDFSGQLFSAGTMSFTITNDTTYDSIQCDDEININDSIVTVSSAFSGPAGSSYEWDILTADNALTYNNNTTINIPTSTAFEIWSQQIVNDSILRLFYVNNSSPTPSGFTPLPGVDTEIANVLAAMEANTTNSGQAQLLAAVDAVTTQNQYNYLLNNLQPDTSNSSSNTTLAMQNIGFNKIEVRVAGAGRKNTVRRTNRRANTKKSQRKAKNFSGIASGNLTPNTAMWVAGFGSLSKQQARGDNQGYRAKILGGMLGIDTRNKNDDVYGLAIGISNANVYNLLNTTFNTRILGYNLMLYGAQSFKKDFFAEEIFSGVINKNHGVRVFSVDSTDLSTESSYRGALGGVRFNFGKNFKLDQTFNLAQVNTLQYVLVHQPSYNETGSVAALQVSTKNNQSILTLGTGVRLGINNNDPWLNGNRELRAMVTYDALSPDQATTANFVVGSNSFIMTSSPARWALKLGADYSFVIAKRLSLGVSYDYEARSGYYDNFGEIKLRYAF